MKNTVCEYPTTPLHALTCPVTCLDKLEQGGVYHIISYLILHRWVQTLCERSTKASSTFAQV